MKSFSCNFQLSNIIPLLNARKPPFSLPNDVQYQTAEPDSEPPPQVRKPKGSSQLRRWSRARAIRTGRRLDRPINRKDDTVKEDAPPSDIWPVLAGDRSDNEEDDGDVTEGKAIYMVSDGTGWTAEHSVNAALGQFEHCLVDRGCPVNTHLFSGVDDVDRLMDIIKQAAKEGALLLYTLADPSMAESAKQACQLWGVPSTDILGPTTEAIAAHLGVSPSGIPRGASGRSAPLTDEYFRRIEAVEFTIKQDDGAQPQNLYKADIVLVGVSRTGKTPLSIYLSQKGYKTIRKARVKSMGLSSENRSNYSEMDHVREELEFANKIFAQNPQWPITEVTGKAVEETAAVIVRIYHDRKQKCTMPRILKQY